MARRLILFLVIAAVLVSHFTLTASSSQAGKGDRAIVYPVPPNRQIAPRVILAFSPLDVDLLCNLTNADRSGEGIWDCSIGVGSWKGMSVTVVGPVVGAPYAVMVIENLIAMNARMILTLGWCGSLNSRVRIGHLMVPASAMVGDGTSRYYRHKSKSTPDPVLLELLKARTALTGIPWHEGKIRSVDAIYRETVNYVRRYQGLGELAIEMETAALFTVGKYRGVAMASLLAVSDELFTLVWNRGWDSPELKAAREAGAQVVLDVAAAWPD
ncbi:MAG: hypothetical protein FJ134_04460 [Deltaproteobacteria bacterium]|nr:hypothetical protein [Deltaproteobacteria bacterium]